MFEVEDMRREEIEALLLDVGYGHLGASADGQPYVVPVHYAFDKPDIYVYTTEGKKVEIIRENPKVCLQLEDVKDNENWRSVVVLGTAEQVTDNAVRETAVALIAKVNPTLTPAVSIRWMDSWVRENIEVILKITPTQMTGRASVERDSGTATYAPVELGKPTNIN